MLEKFNPEKIEKLSKEETIKAHGFDVDWGEIAAIPMDELTKEQKTILKWSGVYCQKESHMMRIRIPAGVITAHQARAIADLATEYARDDICLTTRQCPQFHFMKTADMPAILQKVKDMGLSNKNASGDTVRNICACSWSGVCPHEKVDALKATAILEDVFQNADGLRNLPRKHKINISGCEAACGQPFINDQGWVGTEYNGEKGFKLYGCGGIGSKPFMGKFIFTFVPEEFLIPISKAMVQIHYDFGNRKKRTLARSKIIMNEIGIEAYQKLLLDYVKDEVDVSRILLSADGELDKITPLIDATSPIIEQKQAGKVLVQILVKRGDIKAEQMKQLADITEEFGDGMIRMTQRQNLEIHGVAKENTDTVIAKIHSIGLQTQGHWHIADSVSCVGNTYCNYGIADAPLLHSEIIAKLYPKYLNILKKIVININGCSNGCGQYTIADIGLKGTKTKTENGVVEAFELSLGGDIYEEIPQFNEKIATIPATEVVGVIDTILQIYKNEENKSFRKFYDAKGRDFFVNLIGDGQ